MDTAPLTLRQRRRFERVLRALHPTRRLRFGSAHWDGILPDRVYDLDAEGQPEGEGQDWYRLLQTSVWRGLLGEKRVRHADYPGLGERPRWQFAALRATLTPWEVLHPIDYLYRRFKRRALIPAR